MKRLIVVLSVILFSCSDDPEPVVDAAMASKGASFPKGSAIIGTGEFTTYAHNLSGIASLHSDNAGMKHFTLQQFTMTMGPDVHVYLSKANNFGKANVIELGKLVSAYKKDSVSLDFSAITYDPEYKFVLVYCVEFSSLFGYAELKK